MLKKTKAWCRAAGIRAVKTFAQTAAAGIGVAAAVNTADWLTVISTALTAALLSLLTSAAGLPEIEKEEKE